MDIDKPVVLCYECGEPVEESWQLFCRYCYRKLRSMPPEAKAVNLDSLGKSPAGRFICYDKGGHRYEYTGKAWIRRSG